MLKYPPMDATSSSITSVTIYQPTRQPSHPTRLQCSAALLTKPQILQLPVCWIITTDFKSHAKLQLQAHLQSSSGADRTFIFLHSISFRTLSCRLYATCEPSVALLLLLWQFGKTNDVTIFVISGQCRGKES